MMDLLAGPELPDAEAQRVQLQFLNRLRGTMDDQRLASLDTILGLGDDLNRLSQATVPVITESFTQDAGDIKSLEMPRSIFTSGERNQWASGYIESRHIVMERQTDLAAFVKSPAQRERTGGCPGTADALLKRHAVGLYLCILRAAWRTDAAQ